VPFSRKFSRRVAIVAVVGAAVVAAGALAAFQPVTRGLVAQDAVCFFCHEEPEYNAASKVLWNGVRPITRVHPATPEGGQAGCADCHLPEGLLASAYVYTHILTFTDLFGHFPDYETVRQGPWVAPAAKRAYRVRDGLMESDSVTCRVCHIETEIKPKRKRGQKAHANALKNKETCIECHDHLVHREVPPRKALPK
jgi:nitrate/TMAO reductase-like tetraheme cytochrome c subunit